MRTIPGRAASSRPRSLEQRLHCRQHEGKGNLSRIPGHSRGCVTFWHHHPRSPSPFPQQRNTHSYFFPLLTQLPTPCIHPSQLFPAASRRAAPGAAPCLPLEMAIPHFFLHVELCYCAGLFLCFTDCKVQHCSFETQRAPSSSCP